MEVNVIGRVKNTHLPYSQSLLPLFEAVVNSIHAIEDAHEPNGRITVTVLRQAGLDMVDPTALPIRGFRIEDNGIGFTEENYSAFNESDTTHKVKRGGKGVGRFIWLKAFERIEVESTFIEGEEWRCRKFGFVLRQGNPIESPQLELLDLEADHKRNTTVTLLGFKKKFASKSPKGGRTVATKIVEHCLEFFALHKAPELVLREANGDEFRLQQIFEEDLLVKGSLHTTLADVRGTEFRLRSMRLRSTSANFHSVSFCADMRVVKEDQRIPKSIHNLPPALTEPGGGSSVYACYVSSEFLDASANTERTGFNVLEEDQLFDTPVWSEIEDAVLTQASDYLAEFTGPVREEKLVRIKEYVSSEAPQFRHLLHYRPVEIDELDPSLEGDKLDLELYRISKNHEIEVRREASDLAAAEETLEEDGLEEHKQRFRRFLEEFNDVGKASLARYVIHRKAILSLFEERLRKRDDGKFPLEEAVHRLIFPLRSASEEVAPDQQNLWLLDERLAYHYYLASDKRLDSTPHMEIPSGMEPDLLIFDAPFAFVDHEPPHHAVTVVEFKRPGRSGYSEKENPVSQCLNYVKKIRSGRAMDRAGRPWRVPDAVPFYCFIVCDLTPRFEECAENADLQKTPDGMGYFGYNRAKGAYVEVISFDKLLADAKKRNRVFFDKLNLPVRFPQRSSTSTSS